MPETGRRRPAVRQAGHRRRPHRGEGGRWERPPEQPSRGVWPVQPRRRWPHHSPPARRAPAVDLVKLCIADPAIPAQLPGHTAGPATAPRVTLVWRHREEHRPPRRRRVGRPGPAWRAARAARDLRRLGARHHPRRAHERVRATTPWHTCPGMGATQRHAPACGGWLPVVARGSALETKRTAARVIRPHLAGTCRTPAGRARSLTAERFGSLVDPPPRTPRHVRFSLPLPPNDAKTIERQRNPRQ